MSSLFENCWIIGCDPGPVHSAFAVVRIKDGRIHLTGASYPANEHLNPQILCGAYPSLETPIFLAYEKCGAMGRFVGESVFETAAMGGEIRRAFRSIAWITYVFKSSEWRYLLCGKGNARTPVVYAESCALFEPTGGGADPYKGTTAAPGPLWALHQAGKGGNVEHLKDALGCALALTRSNFRTGEGPDKYKRPW